MGKVYNISPNQSFVDVLACWLLNDYKDDPLALSRVRVLLPTQRAIRSLQEAFLRHSPDTEKLDGSSKVTKALVLPRMDAIGGLDSDEMMLLEPTGLGDGGGQLGAKQSMDTLQRVFLLTRLVLAAGQTLAPRPDSPELKLTFQQALRMAIGLGQLLDQAETEGVNLSAISELKMKAELAHHWEDSKHFLEILSVVWPQILTDRGLVSKAEQRRKLMEQQEEVWQTNPPKEPVIVAGSTGSIPSTRKILKAIADLPTGILILPGLDQHMIPEVWELIDHDPSHPQFNLKQLIDACQVARNDIELLPTSIADGDRQKLLSDAMLPASATENWRKLKAGSYTNALANFSLIAAKTAQDEAQTIAVIMRKSLLEPGKTTALITPDRLLARRVIIEMRRWGVEIDDSAGLPLKNTTAGLLFRQTAQCLVENLSPVTLLAVLKHPYALIEAKHEKNKRLLYRFESSILRGEKPAAGTQGLEKHLRQKIEQAQKKPIEEEVIEYAENLIQVFEPFVALSEGTHSFADYLSAHLSLLAALDKGGNLWQAYNGGEELSSFIEKLSLATSTEGEYLDAISADAYVDSLEALINGETVRQKFGLHPRLSIWGTMEGRLQQADCLILSGLNEGTWPKQTEAGPWLSRPMRQELNLPSTERKIGLSSHDFTQACGAKEVYLTRALKDGGAETRPSRLLQRLETVMAKLGLSFDQQKSDIVKNWAAALERPSPATPKVFAQPQFAPPIETRPLSLSITDVETLIRDPYAVYLKRILNIFELDPIEADVGIAERGTVIHDVLDTFIKQHPQGPLPHLALQELMLTGRQAFERLNTIAPGATAFWWPRFRRIADWFIAEETRRRKVAPNSGTLGSYVEVKGQTPIGSLSVYGRADRIDKLADGRFEIIDYKTGTAPTGTKVRNLESPQLLLEALMLEQGGFSDIKGNTVVQQIAYWQLIGSGKDKAKITKLNDKDKEKLGSVLEKLETFLVEYFAFFGLVENSYVSLPDPDKAPRYQTYKNLVREDEWRLGADEFDGEANR